ncbi:MAG: rhodanese-like domain-containing protein, partial [Anaerolineae bacterium]
MTRKKRKSSGGRKGARSRSTKPRRTQSSRSRQVRQQGWRRQLPIAALILAAVIISVGGVWFFTRRGNTGPTVTEATTNDLANVPRIAPQELKAKLDAGQAVVFDARRQSDYTQKHIAGAISLPQGEVA